jgi:predicted dehydrogenase
MKNDAGLLSRRGFLQLGATTAIASRALAMGPTPPSPYKTMAGVPFRKREPRLGLIGTGGRGTSLLKNLLGAEARVVGLCDVVPEKAKGAQALVTATGQASPELYTEGPHAYQKMLQRDDIDLVIVATPWSWHAEMVVCAMDHGKDVAVEVPAVTTIADCWRIVDTSERTRRHCMMLENCCYGYNETLVLRMIHAGLFGDLLYGEGAYLHDLREELFSNAGEGLWRRAEHTLHNGNLYPTHGLGPVANYMGIQRGDRFDYVVSMSSPQRGLDSYRTKHLKAGDPRLSEKYVTGDMNTSLIKTTKGLTITVKHTVSTPHPYDRVNQIAGTEGIFEDYPPRLYLDGQNADESWGTLDKWKEYEHPLWKKEGELARKMGGHGGMDYIMLYRLLECVRLGIAPDMDVYDAAAWSSVVELSVQSVGHGSRPIEFPDFTRGIWKSRPFSPIGTTV